MYEFFETFEKAFELVVKDKVIGNFLFCKGEMYVSQIMSTPKKTNWRFIKKIWRWSSYNTNKSFNLLSSKIYW